MNNIEDLMKKAKSLLNLTDSDIEKTVKNKIDFYNFSVTEYVKGGIEALLEKHEQLLKAKRVINKKLTVHFPHSNEYKVIYLPSAKEIESKKLELNETFTSELKEQQAIELDNILNLLISDAQIQREKENELALIAETNLMKEKMKEYLLQQ